MILLTLAAAAFALGRDYPTCALDFDVQGLAPLVEGCVHHYAVNNSDVLFFDGDAQALEAHRSGLAALAPVTVVTHTGPTEVRSPWDEAPRDLTATWRTALEFDCRRGGRRCRLVSARLDIYDP